MFCRVYTIRTVFSIIFNEIVILNQLGFIHRLLIEPDFVSGTSNGSVWIDVIRDSLEKGLPPIVLDINNITITEAKGTFHIF